MSKIRTSISFLILTAIITASPVYVYADDIRLEEGSDILEDLSETSSEEIPDITDTVPDIADFSMDEGIEIPSVAAGSGEKREDIPGGLRRDVDMPDLPLSERSDGEFLSALSKGNSEFNGALPSSYSNRDRLPAVRNQNPYGTCWSFSAVGCMEADRILDGESRSIDYSELQVVYFAANKYTDPKKCRKDYTKSIGSPLTYLKFGGILREAPRLFANHIGAVDESTVPYDEALTFRGGTSYVTSKDVAHMKTAYYITYDTGNLDRIKKAIVLHGGVSAGYGHNDDNYDEENHSYYNPKGYKDVSAEGHAIILVGWDDDFSRDNFRNKKDEQPKKDGAWLVRNSWGEGWGDGGYFWLSYYDGGLLKETGNGYTVAFDARSEDADNCYSYDGQYYKDLYLNTTKTCWVKQTYTVSKGEALTGVSFELFSSDADVKVTVRNKKTREKATGSLKTSYPGIYTVKLSNKMYIASRSDVEVVLQFTADGDISVVCEEPKSYKFNSPGGGYVIMEGVCDKGFYAKAKSGSAYQKLDADPRIKLYTVKSKAPSKVSVQSVSLDRSKRTLKKGKSFKLKATILPTNATNKKVTWKSSNKKIATVSSKGVVKGIKPGKATITVTTKDGKKKAKCKVTVKKK